jgi:hypothetical protein
MSQRAARRGPIWIVAAFGLWHWKTALRRPEWPAVMPSS